jgi:hypothetical protein
VAIESLQPILPLTTATTSEAQNDSIIPSEQPLRQETELYLGAALGAVGAADVLDVATPVLVAPAIPPLERLRPRQATTVRQQRREVIEEGDGYFGELTMAGEARSRR